MPDDGENLFVGDDVLGIRDADIGLGLIVVGHELVLEAHLGEVAAERLYRELGAELDAFAERRLTTAQGALRGDLNGALPLRLEGRGRGNQRHAEGQRQQEHGPDQMRERVLLLTGVGLDVRAIIASGPRGSSYERRE